MMMKIKNKYCTKILSVSISPFRLYSNIRAVAVTGKNSCDFYSWFVGFADAESSFSIVSKQDSKVSKQDSKGNINRFTFMFVIGLHLDDLEALNYIHNKLNIGIVRIAKDECKFVVTKEEELSVVISIFDMHNLNTSKYLDYLDFKKAFNLYFNREEGLTEGLKKRILELKGGMNTKRLDFNMPTEHKIRVTKS